MDIVFVIDASRSIGECNFRDKLCKYVADAVEKFTCDIRAGVVVYSSSVGTTISIQNNSDGLVRSIRSLSYIGDSTNTADAIEAAKDLLLDQHPARIKVMAVLTDGESDSKPTTAEKATEAKKAGIQIYAIGIGAGASSSVPGHGSAGFAILPKILRSMLDAENEIATEIKEIASSPTTRYAHNIAGFGSKSFDEDIQKLLDDARATKPSYEMNCNPHGMALIINNYQFHGRRGLNDLDGYLHDEENLEKMLRHIKYEVTVRRNLTTKEINDFMKMDKIDHSKYDSFICCVLSHGGEGYFVDNGGHPYYIQDFTKDLQEVDSLRGKPKIIFIHACRGKNAIDHDPAMFMGFALQHMRIQPDIRGGMGSMAALRIQPDIRGGMGSMAAFKPTMTLMYGDVQEHYERQFAIMKECFQTLYECSQIPRAADFFFGYATPLHYNAFVPDGGSHYITELCRSMRVHAFSGSLNDIMTVTNRAVGECLISGEHKEVPVFNSRARKNIFF